MAAKNERVYLYIQQYLGLERCAAHRTSDDFSQVFFSFSLYGMAWLHCFKTLLHLAK